MLTFLLISRHAPESCWLFNKKSKDIHRNLLENMDKLLKKYDVKLRGSWYDIPGHTLYEVYDAPDLEAFARLGMEPEIMQWSTFNTMEIKMVTTLEDVKGMLKV